MFRGSLAAALLALAVLFVPPALAAAQDATPAAVNPPTPPGQPMTGPGGAEYPFTSVRVISLGDDGGGGRLFEPTTDTADGTLGATKSLPLVLLLDGCCYKPEGSTVSGGGGDGGAGFETWIDHLVRRGAIVVYPIYRGSHAQEDIATAMQAALAALASGDHAQPDTAHMAVIGFSFSGWVAADYIAAAAAAGLPVPRALLVYGPAWVDPVPDGAPPPETHALVLVGENDFGTLMGAQQIWEWLAPLPTEQRDFLTLPSDDHGEPSLVADHAVPLTEPRPIDPLVDLDALDWYGIWKLTDALMACTFTQVWCEYAFGDTAEQRFMGTWSDGVPVKELVVTADPATP
ncbi:MAG: hypothetical protein K0R44_1808 [Thermomicrobiales bacterium]|nr:hypothetical protein [Thermomicrobiales bacterium]